MKVSSILEQIASTRGTNAKTDILREHSSNELLQRVLKAGLDNFTPFNVVKIPKVIERCVLSDELVRWNMFLDFLGCVGCFGGNFKPGACRGMQTFAGFLILSFLVLKSLRVAFSCFLQLKLP